MLPFAPVDLHQHLAAKAVHVEGEMHIPGRLPFRPAGVEHRRGGLAGLGPQFGVEVARTVGQVRAGGLALQRDFDQAAGEVEEGGKAARALVSFSFPLCLLLLPPSH